MYLQRRQRFPKANLEDEVMAIQLNDKHVCIHIATKITNIGSGVLQMKSARSSIHQVLPLGDEMQQRLDSEDALYDDVRKEIKWPELGINECN